MSVLVIQLLTESELIFCSSRKLDRTEENQKKFLTLITPYYACSSHPDHNIVDQVTPLPELYYN